MNQQRQAFYTKRRSALENEDIHSEILDMTEGALVDHLNTHWPEKGEPEPEAIVELVHALEGQFGIEFDPKKPPFLDDGKLPEREALAQGLLDGIILHVEDKKKACDELAKQHDGEYPPFDFFERSISLQILDAQWKDHLHTMDGLREGISLRGYASRDPKIEYQREGFALFDEMDARIDHQTAQLVFRFALPAAPGEAPPHRSAPPSSALAPTATPPPAAVRPGPAATRPGGLVGASGQKPVEKVGRNDPCPCGSGNKFKKCHGR
jgi:preprotein translocase subunit SecA